ncbi:D-arabinitol 4-dehydrogenase [Citrobacter sp. JGM124]|uniref:D-arabinitol 4-dehydrogenase n=1 Tax=Citrobacter sp. JGM124 TaxID=2799789 RepID=UPI001BA6598E|nr:D-arabinitol 4-dehydrogenase [Citrobacter sp. JGM124]MBS0847883.1 mannitol dehydrogenase family protein [Citrobacter sp. JGM124]
MTTSKPYYWMHLGAGSFHRAHQAWYLHRLLAQGDDRWHIALGNIRNDAQPLLDALDKQQGRYTLETVTPEGERVYETITSVKKVLPWDEELSALVAQGADENTKVISFTVTEGGYYLDTNHQLDPRHPDIQADLAGEARTIYGALARILRARMKQHGQPVTLLNCDNLRHNGERFRAGFLAFLQLSDDQDLYQWVLKQTTSPNTMVDRITPRPTADIAVRVQEQTGVDDQAPVMGEAFIQWVIEDHFIAGRPALENVGVEMVESVLPWEEAKIRILNASHSCIAWAGTLKGQSYIHESTQTDAIRQLAWNYVTEDVIPSLSPSPLDLEQYRDVVLSRFSNPYIQDTNQRVAADGLSKIPGFITPTLVECYQRGAEPRATAVLPALFFLFLQRWHRGELPYTYQDGVLNEDAMHTLLAADDALDRFTADETLFGPLATDARFAQLMRETVAQLEEAGYVSGH